MFYQVRSKGSWGCLPVFLLVAALLIFVVPALLKWIYILSALLIVVAALIHWRSLAVALRALWRTAQSKPVVGLVSAALLLLFLPFSALALLTYALLLKRHERPAAADIPSFNADFSRFVFDLRGKSQPEEADFEEIESRPASKSRIDEHSEGKNI